MISPMATGAFFSALVALLAWLAIYLPASSISAVVALATTTRRSPSLGPLRRSFVSLSSWLVFVLVLLGTFVPSVSAAPWSPDLCVRPTSIGSSSGGAPFTILGEAGSSVTGLRLYRNNGADGYLRGLVASFSDGSEMVAGVRKDQYSEITLGEGEVITGMTLWAFTPPAKGWKAKVWKSAATPRVGRIDIATNRRTWGYGVDSTAKLKNKAVNVGSGVLVGFQGRAGDDLDQIAPIFLATVSESVVDGLVFERLPGNDGLVLETLKEGTAVWNGTDYSYTFAGSTTREVSTRFSSSTSNGLSLKTTFRAALPQLLESGIDAGWNFGATKAQDQASTRSAQLSWSSTVSMSADTRAVFCSAMVWRGHITLRWSGTQTISAADGASVSFPTSGVLERVDYGKVETVCRPLSARRWVA
ncbi:hypothetical protein VTH06DRAFT_101 [Thermothelomyces fergusii]